MGRQWEESGETVGRQQKDSGETAERQRGDSGETAGRQRGDSGETAGRQRVDSGETAGRQRGDSGETDLKAGLLEDGMVVAPRRVRAVHLHPGVVQIDELPLPIPYRNTHNS